LGAGGIRSNLTDAAYAAGDLQGNVFIYRFGSQLEKRRRILMLGEALLGAADTNA